ncbi:hypothetical protein [Nocardioides sp.]|uniref:hypothetical protein n=1 Tax=Nocardioides sp. TaxID=35761 RepID=UPI003527BFA7
MSLELAVYILTALAAVVVVLTRLRLRKESAAGESQVPRAVLNGHTLFGVLGLAAWITYLVAPEDSPAGRPEVGLGGLACLWIVVVCGVLILLRWLPSHGRHVSPRAEDSWSDGPGLSVLAHLGMVAGVSVLTIVYAFGAI